MEFKDELFARGVPLDAINPLIGEFQRGEVGLLFTKTTVIRQVEVMHTKLFCLVAGQKYQLFKNGTESFQCKLWGDDSPNQVLDTLRSMLKIARFHTIDAGGKTYEDRPTEGHPGLLTRVLTQEFIVTLHPGDFKPEGYTYALTPFTWQPVS